MSKLFTGLILLGIVIAIAPLVGRVVTIAGGWLYSLSNVQFGLLFAGASLVAWLVCGVLFGERR